MGLLPRRPFTALAEAPEPGVRTLAQAGEGGAPDTAVCRVAEVLAFPAYGTVLDRRGRAYRSTAGGALACRPDLGCLPPAGEAPTLDGGAVWLPWGGTFNYGHFLLDGLTSLLALDELRMLAGHPAVAPPLSAWQRDLLRIGFPETPITETGAPAVRLRQAAFATSMDHFLNGPNDLLRRLRERLLTAAPPPAGQRRRLYFSRRGQSMRVLVNEAELEAALQDRGFQVVEPERLSVSEQISLARSASVIVGPTGAAFANALFAPEGARLVEVQPENFRSEWVGHLARAAGLDGSVHLCPSPLPAGQAPVLAKLRRGFRFAYRLPLAPFLADLDARL